MVRDAAETRARAAYETALADVHGLVAAVQKVPFPLQDPHWRWTEDQRSVVAEYAAAWALVVATCAELETLLARRPGR